MVRYTVEEEGLGPMAVYAVVRNEYDGDSIETAEFVQAVTVETFFSKGMAMLSAMAYNAAYNALANVDAGNTQEDNQEET